MELAPRILARALEPFPVPVGTLDALHLATVMFVNRDGTSLGLATYDARLGEAASAAGIPLWEVGMTGGRSESGL